MSLESVQECYEVSVAPTSRVPRSLFPSAVCTGSERHVTGALAHSVSGPAMHHHRGVPVARRVLMQDVTPKPGL